MFQVIIIHAGLTTGEHTSGIGRFNRKNASGVSSFSWLVFSGISATWFVYGILHKDKHIFLMNASLVVVQALVGISAIIYG